MRFHSLPDPPHLIPCFPIVITKVPSNHPLYSKHIFLAHFPFELVHPDKSAPVLCVYCSQPLCRTSPQIKQI